LIPSQLAVIAAKATDNITSWLDPFPQASVIFELKPRGEDEE
jgi:hypothetical protein